MTVSVHDVCAFLRNDYHTQIWCFRWIINELNENVSVSSSLNRIFYEIYPGFAYEDIIDIFVDFEESSEYHKLRIISLYWGYLNEYQRNVLSYHIQTW